MYNINEYQLGLLVKVMKNSLKGVFSKEACVTFYILFSIDESLLQVHERIGLGSPFFNTVYTGVPGSGLVYKRGKKWSL